MPLVVYIVHALLTLNWFWNCRLVHHLLLSSKNLQIHTLVSGTCYIIVFMRVKIRFNCSLNPSRSVLSALCVIIIMSFVICFIISTMAMTLSASSLWLYLIFFLPVWTSKRSNFPRSPFYPDKWSNFWVVWELEIKAASFRLMHFFVENHITLVLNYCRYVYSLSMHLIILIWCTLQLSWDVFLAPPSTEILNSIQKHILTMEL